MLPTPHRPERATDVEVIIQSPSIGPYGPLEHPIGTNCVISASGTLDYHNTKVLRSIQGQVNGGAFVEGYHDGRNWTISGMRAAHNGAGNMLIVQGTYTDYSAVTPATREFIGIGGYGCSQLMLRRRPLLPRYYALSLDGGPDSVGPFGKLLLGGLLTKTQVFLSYDHTASVPETPVWRDINLPHAAGHWLLRLFLDGSTITAQLVLTRVTETAILKPLIWSTSDWQMSGPNCLVPESSFEDAQMASNLWIEPA